MRAPFTLLTILICMMTLFGRSGFSQSDNPFVPEKTGETPPQNQPKAIDKNSIPKEFPSAPHRQPWLQEIWGFDFPEQFLRYPVRSIREHLPHHAKDDSKLELRYQYKIYYNQRRQINKIYKYEFSGHRSWLIRSYSFSYGANRQSMWVANGYGKILLRVDFTIHQAESPYTYLSYLFPERFSDKFLEAANSRWPELRYRLLRASNVYLERKITSANGVLTDRQIWLYPENFPATKGLITRKSIYFPNSGAGMWCRLAHPWLKLQWSGKEPAYVNLLDPEDQSCAGVNSRTTSQGKYLRDRFQLLYRIDGKGPGLRQVSYLTLRQNVPTDSLTKGWRWQYDFLAELPPYLRHLNTYYSSDTKEISKKPAPETGDPSYQKLFSGFPPETLTGLDNLLLAPPASTGTFLEAIQPPYPLLRQALRKDSQGRVDREFLFNYVPLRP